MGSAREIAAITLIGTVGTFAAACAPSEEREVHVDRGVDVAGVTVTDVYRPSEPAPDPDGYPVVVMLHGGDGDASGLTPLAALVAESGAVVHVPTWPVITERLTGAALDEAYFDQVEAVVCSLRHARRTAPEHGGDPDDLTLLGHSAGGFVGAAVAMVDEPPWPTIGCDAGVEHRPERFIGTSGDYTGWTLFAEDSPDVAAPYDPTVLPVTNEELDVHLIHGFADDTIWPEEPWQLRNHLVAEAVDVTILALDVDHGGPLERTGAVEFVAEQLTDLLADRPTAFEPERSATLSFVDDRCLYEGPEELAQGDAVAIDVHNDAEVRVYFWLMAFERWRPTDAVVELGGGPWVPVEQPPEDPMARSFFPVEAGQTTEFVWAFVDGSRPWTLWCLPHDEHPASGMMHLAAELVALDASDSTP